MIECKIFCDECKKEKDADLEFYTCDECSEKLISESVFSAVEEVYEKDYHWKDKETYVGFKSEKEKEIYMKGVKYGYESSLFWISELFGLVDKFEILAGWRNKDETK